MSAAGDQPDAAGEPLSLTVTAGGEELPQVRTMSASYFACEDGIIHWRILTPDPASADVVVIARSPD